MLLLNLKHIISTENHRRKAEFRTSFSIATGRFASWDWPRASKDTMQSQSQQGCSVLRETGTWSTRGDLCMGVGIQSTKIHIQNQNSFRIQSDTACRLWHLYISFRLHKSSLLHTVSYRNRPVCFSTEAFIRLHWWLRWVVESSKHLFSRMPFILGVPRISEHLKHFTHGLDAHQVTVTLQKRVPQIWGEFRATGAKVDFEPSLHKIFIFDAWQWACWGFWSHS